ncbi:DNA-binding transcriptional regulator GadX [compost metagenome]
MPSITESARTLGMSVRTLRRQLLREGTSYQALLDGFRRDLAMEYLNSGHMTPKEVGYLLGFQSASNFRRAFRAWTGQTIGEYLNSRLPEDS